MIADGLLVKATPIGGIYADGRKGVFAQRSFGKGEVVVKVRGAKIADTDRRLSHRGVQVGKHLFIEPARGSAIWYLNHSCKPNAYMDMDRLITRRSIRKGEEITADYSLFTDYAKWDMKCACKEKSCRKVIVPFSKLKSKPKTYISSYLRC